MLGKIIVWKISEFIRFDITLSTTRTNLIDQQPVETSSCRPTNSVKALNRTHLNTLTSIQSTNMKSLQKIKQTSTTSLCSTSHVGWQRGTARICCCAPCSDSSIQQAGLLLWAHPGTDRCIDPALHTMLAVPNILQQSVYISSLIKFHKISRIQFKKFQKIFTW